MQTVVRSDSAEVTIRPDSHIVIVGESINPSGRKRLAEALMAGNFDYVTRLAAEQVVAGADILDINVGLPGLDETVMLPEVVKTVTAQVNVPLCIDSSNPKALAAALAVAHGKPLLNSVNGREASLREVLPIARDRGAAVVGLTMDDKGIANDPSVRLAIAARIVERAVRIGIAAEDVLIDPLAMTVGADQKAGDVALRTIELVRRKLGVNIIVGASNVSFGLPQRHSLNQAFLCLAAAAGASCVITDPAKFAATIRAIDLIRGCDPHARRYISHCRAAKA